MKIIFLVLAFGSALFRTDILHAADKDPSILSEKIRVKSYRVVRYTVTSADGRQQRLVTREIGTDQGDLFYFIDTATLRFGLADKLEGKKTEGGPAPDSFLGKVIAAQRSSGRPYGTAGEFHSGTSNKNIVLTTDLCPTGNDYDSQFYSNLVSLRKDRLMSVPLVIFFSGRWVKNHSSQLASIKGAGLDFIAGNHTYSHKILDGRNTDAGNFTAELTNTETVLLENGILPSFFFRYPGLVYNKTAMDVLDKLSMTAVNANVWMGTKARNWGILLVHSNGCASSEVRVFATYTARNLKRLKTGELRFHSMDDYLRETLSLTNAAANLAH
jgi:peptidoglycan/xylan/chitin deacetylase (PgdA/CDA1 family)